MDKPRISGGPVKHFGNVKFPPLPEEKIPENFRSALFTNNSIIAQHVRWYQDSNPGPPAYYLLPQTEVNCKRTL